MTTANEQTHLSKWGNSSATRIPSNIIKKLNLDNDQTFDIFIENGAIVLKPVRKQAKNIHDLFAGWHDDGIREHELDWGDSQGKEFPW